MGGNNIRVFAAHHPEMVSGMVLVDASHEDQYNQFKNKLPSHFNRPGNILILPKAIDSLAHAHKPTILRERTFHVARAEISSLEQSALQIQILKDLPDVPLLMVTRGKPEWLGNQVLQQRKKIWIDMQQALSRLSSESTHMFAHQSGHANPHERPEISIEAIEQILRQVPTRNIL